MVKLEEMIKKNKGIFTVLLYIILISILDVVFVRVFGTNYLAVLIPINFCIFYLFWRMTKTQREKGRVAERTKGRRVNR